MIACIACGAWLGVDLCPACESRLVPANPFVTASGVLVRPAMRHEHAARLLVHRLKYDGIVAAAELLAAAMTRCLPQAATALVPVPRALMRRWVHGVDPAQLLAHAIARRSGVPVVAALRPAPWWPRHAGRDGARRSAARFRAAVTPAEATWVLVDDVVTTGATLDAAADALGGVVRLAVAATSPSRVAAWGRGTDLVRPPTQ